MAAKRQVLIAAIGAIIIIGILVLIGLHSVSNLYIIPAGTFDPFHRSDPQAGTTVGNTRAEDDSPRSGEIVLATYGNRNRTAGNESTNSTSYDPGSFSDAILTDMQPYLYPKGPVIGFWQKPSGTFEVMYYEDWPVNRTMIDEMYSRIAAKGKDYGFDQIPCRVLSMGMVQSDIAYDAVPGTTWLHNTMNLRSAGLPLDLENIRQ